MNESATTVPSASGSEKTRIWPMYRAVIGVGVACALVIVVVYEVTKPIIQRNKINLRMQAVMQVLPGAQRSATFRLQENGRFEPTSPDSEGTDLVFAGYDQRGELVGVAIEARGMGYQDIIRLLYGYSFDAQTIIGIRVLESRETPGLGDRIETDTDFLKNFEKLDVRVSEDGDSLIHPIEFVRPGEKNEAWQIDGISGATISSQATAQMLRESSQWWIPRVRASQADLLYMDNAETAGGQ